MVKSKREREEACHICGHYHDYEGGVPCGICGHRLQHTTEKSNPPSAYPSEILPGFLYLGSYDNASRCELLKTMDITHILNTVPSSPNLYKNSFTYETVADVPPDFAACNQFIDMAKGAKSRVLVHCMTGITRSPAVVCAYLMHMRRWRLSESFKWLADKHPRMQLSLGKTIRPDVHEGDQKRLQEFEVQCLGSSSVGFGGLQMLQEPQVAVASAAQQQPQQLGVLFSWPGSSAEAAAQPQQQQTSNSRALPPLASAAPFASFNFAPGGGSGAGFVFGAAPQQ